MTREEEIYKIASAFAIDEVKDTCNPASKRGLLYAGFVGGAEWADQHPHWISVEDKLPPKWGKNPNVSVSVITFGYLGESSIPFVELQRYHFGDGRWLYGKATHWMPFQYPKKGGGQ